MKKYLLLSSIILASCGILNNREKNNNNNISFTNLTNDSIKFWETSTPIKNTRLGLYFSKDGTCDEYEIDQNQIRKIDYYGDLILSKDKPFHFKLERDSLNMYIGEYSKAHFRLEWFKILKLTNDSLVVQETFGTNKLINDKPWTAIYRYSVSRDQHTKPEYFQESNPYEKNNDK